MQHHDSHPDFGTGQKKLGIYVFGLVGCTILTLLAFWAVMVGTLSKGVMLTVIFSAAFIQFLMQVICFLRLNTDTPQARTNVVSILFTIVVLVTILIGSLWIMWNVNYYMM